MIEKFFKCFISKNILFTLKYINIYYIHCFLSRPNLFEQKQSRQTHIRNAKSWSIKSDNNFQIEVFYFNRNIANKWSNWY